MTNKDLNDIIAKSLDLNEEVIAESYVAQDKQFSLPTEKLSTETKDVHIELYQHYVQQLNHVSARLDTVPRKDADASHSDFRSLKYDEVFNMNAVYLHELYFANISDPYSEITMDSLTFMRLERDFGTFDMWQRDFIACALSAREGWAITAYSTFLKRFVNVFIDSHNHSVPVGCYPVVCVDVWSHSYFHDRMGDKKSYIVDMMKEFNWAVIEERFKRAEMIAEALR